MKRVSFTILSVVLAAVISVAMLFVLRSSEGVLQMADNRLSARVAEKAEPVNNGGFIEIPPLPDEPRELTCEDVNHIYLNGVKCDFPLKLSELPDGFSYMAYRPENSEYVEIYNGYDHGFFLYYNGITWAIGSCITDEKEAPDIEDVEISILQFSAYLSEGTEYATVAEGGRFPQIVICGVDPYNYDIDAFRDVYGSSRVEGGKYEIADPVNNGTYTISERKGRVYFFRYIRNK